MGNLNSCPWPDYDDFIGQLWFQVPSSMPKKSGWFQKWQHFSEILPRLPNALHGHSGFKLAISSCELGLWRSVLLIISVCSSKKLILAACIPWALKYERRSFLVKKKIEMYIFDENSY